MEKNAASLPSDLRESNRKLVLSTFGLQRENTAVQIAEKTGLSRQTVKKCIDYYLNIGVLENCGKGSSTSIGGKRPDMYCFQREIRLVSIQLHHYDIEIVFFDLNCNRTGYWNSGYMVFNSLDNVLEQIRKGFEVLKTVDKEGKILMVTMAAPFGYAEDYSINEATPFSSWPKEDFKRDLHASLASIFPDAKKIKLDPDGTAAGAALLQRDYDTFYNKIYVTFYTSNGVGGSLFIDGIAQNSRFMSVCALGHFIVAPEDPEACFCGNHGCLERQVSLKRLRQRMKQRQQEYEISFLKDIAIEELTYQDIFRGSEAGDRLCQQESKRSAAYFAIAVKNIILTIGPDYIVFQGEFGNADLIFQKELQNQIESMKMMKSYKGEILYDRYSLNEEEALGNSYRMIQEFLAESDELFAERI